jgi:hypothetical protein
MKYNIDGLIYWAPTPKLGGGWICHKDSPSPPPAPDYTGAAQATAAGNVDAARFATKANRVSQYTPYGSQTYTNGINGDPDQWRSDINLSPTGQKLLDYQNAASMGLGDQTTQALGRVDNALSQPFDYGSVQDVQDAAYKAQTDRLDPQWQQRQGMTETQLVNQGLRPGTEAYDNAMRDFNVGRNDAYGQARQNAINTAPQTYQMASALRNQPLNELNALRTGSQVTNPTFNNAPQQATTQGADLLGAANSQYGAAMGANNSQAASNANFNNGLMSLAGTAAMFAF